MTEADAVAVVGLGCVYPGAADVEAFWAGIVAGRDAIADAPVDRLDPQMLADLTGPDHLGSPRGGFVPDAALRFEPGRFGIMPVAAADAEPDQLLALSTAAAALDDAGGLDQVARDRIGVILGRGGYLTPGLVRLDQRVRTANQLLTTMRQLLPEVDDERLVAVRDAFADELGERRPESAIGLVPNLAASRIANRLDLGGPAYTVDAACASSLIAVDSALAELASGRCDAVLAGGVHHCHDITLWSVFSQLGALSTSGQIRPFSRHADGILIAEGTGVLVLERLADAHRLGHRVYAVIAGTGVASDGRGASLMSPGVDGQVLALERAYVHAGIDPATVELVEGHGTATRAGDETELATLRQVYRVVGASPTRRRVLGSVKSNIGHAMPAAGAAGLIKAVLAVHHGVLPPTLHGEEPHPDLADSGFCLLDRAEPWSAGGGPRRAGVNAFGFGGINAHVVVTEHRDPSRHPATPRPAVGAGRVDRGTLDHDRPQSEADAWRPAAAGSTLDVLLLAGRDAADLAEQLRRRAAADPDPGRVGSAASGSVVPDHAGPARLAIVGVTPKRLDLAARVLEKGRPWRGRNDLWFEPRGLVADGGKVAFLYPGVEPSFDAELSDVAAWLGTPLPPMPEGATDLERQGREIFGAGRLLHAALGELGIAADEVAGHSLGEWTGVFTAELIPATEADAFLDDLEPGALETPGVVFVALGCGAEVAEAVIAGEVDGGGGHRRLAGVSVSHDNCPHQSVICGPGSAMDEAVARFAARKVIAVPLPFRSGFHSPHFAPYLDLVRHHWARMPLQAPRTRMWSATTGAPYPAEPDAVRQLALDHLVQPVRFRQLTERLHDAGVRAFVQLGVGSLTAFVDDTLKGRDQLTVSAASATAPGLEQLARVGAALWVEGVDVALDRLVAAVRPSTAEAPPPRPVGPSIQLSLGSPLVRLPDPAALELGRGIVPAPDRAGAALSSLADTAPLSSAALQAELDALVAETLAAGQEVATALVRRGPRPARVGHRGSDPAAPSGPHGGGHPNGVGGANGAASDRPAPAGASVAPGSADEWHETLEVGLDAFPWLVDHCFYRQPEGWDDPADRFPVLPMTTMVDLLGQAAVRLAPGRVVTRIERIRASRWLVGAPSTTVVLRARRRGPDEVEASIEGYVRATVCLADAPAAPPAPTAEVLCNPRPSPVGPGPLYADHWMFHGPTFQGVRTIEALGDDGVDGRIEVLPTPGAFLDNAGQLYGWWVMATAEADFLALPQSIESIELFGPPLPVGAHVDTTVRITDLDARTVRADLELRDEHDRVAVRIIGWVDRRFDSDADLWLMLRQPEHHLLATPTEPGYVAVEERWRDSASRELMARRYLDAEERAEYQALNPQAQRRWLLGRIAAKDAVRHALWSGGNGALFPIEVPLAAPPGERTSLDGDGVVVVRGGPARGWTVAVGVAEWVGVARVDAAAIRVEPVAEGGADTAAVAERLTRELADGPGRPTWSVGTARLASPVHLTAAADLSEAGPPDPTQPHPGPALAMKSPGPALAMKSPGPALAMKSPGPALAMKSPGPALAMKKEYVVAWTTAG